MGYGEVGDEELGDDVTTSVGDGRSAAELLT
jgi:hypothetical protein